MQARSVRSTLMTAVVHLAEIMLHVSTMWPAIHVCVQMDLMARIVR